MALMRRKETWDPFRWDPFREMETLSNRLNQFFGLTKPIDDGDKELLAMTDWSPSCDISETEKAYRIHAELPGVNRDDVHVTLEGGVLSIQGERRAEREDKGMRFHRRELSYGNFVRRFTMPDDADESKVDAAFKDGVLNVMIGKTKAKMIKAKEIEVH